MLRLYVVITGLLFISLLSGCKCDEILIDERDTTPPEIGELNFLVNGDEQPVVTLPGERFEPFRFVVLVEKNPITVKDQLDYFFKVSDEESGIKQYSVGIDYNYQCGDTCTADGGDAPLGYDAIFATDPTPGYAMECMNHTQSWPMESFLSRCDTADLAYHGTGELPCAAYFCPLSTSRSTIRHEGRDYVPTISLQIQAINGVTMEYNAAYTIAFPNDCVLARRESE